MVASHHGSWLKGRFMLVPKAKAFTLVSMALSGAAEMASVGLREGTETLHRM